MPLLAKTVDTVPLADPAGLAAPLVERAVTPMPLPDLTAPLAEEQVQTACLESSIQWAMPPSEIGKIISTPPEESDGQNMKVEPAKPDSFWTQGEGASGPLPTEADTSTPLGIDFVSPTEMPPVDTHTASSALLAIPESSEISPVESPQRPDGPECAPIESDQPPIRPYTGRPSVTEILQQQMVCEEIIVTTTNTEETVLQQPLETEAEPMVISGGNTPVAPDDEELDTEDDQALMMDETHL